MKTYPEYEYQAMVFLEGLLSGIVADGKIVSEELVYLDYWLTLHEDLHETFPFSIFFTQVQEILSKGTSSPGDFHDFFTWVQDWLSSIPAGGPQRDPGSETLDEVLDSIPLNTPLIPRDLIELRTWISYHTPSLTRKISSSLLRHLGKVLADRILTERELAELKNLIDRA